MKITDKFEKKAGVYIFQCLINGKFYVGETLNVYDRMKTHKWCGDDQLFNRAVKKYGMENFEITVYYPPDFKKIDLIDLEEQMIIKFKSLRPNGYNVLPRGTDHSGIPLSAEHKAKISKIHKGKIVSAETRLKLSKQKIGVKRKPYTEEHKRKLGDAARGSKRSEAQNNNQSDRRIKEEELKRVSRSSLALPGKIELDLLVYQYTMMDLGKQFGLSNKAMRRYCLRVGVTDFPPIGYWRKNGLEKRW